MSDIEENNTSPVKQRREELGLTQLQLAYLAGVTPATISNIETGKYSSTKLSPDQFVNICHALKWEKVSEIPRHWGPIASKKNDAN